MPEAMPLTMSIISWTGRSRRIIPSRDPCSRVSPGADVAGVGPSPGVNVGGVGPVPLQMWQGVSLSGCEDVGRDGPSPGADVAAV
jgi:hypothetical protein